MSPSCRDQQIGFGRFSRDCFDKNKFRLAFRVFDLKFGWVSDYDRVDGFWQTDGSDKPSYHLHHRDFSIDLCLGKDLRLDLGNLRKGRASPKRETQETKSTESFLGSPRRLVAEVWVTGLRAVSYRMAR